MATNTPERIEKDHDVNKRNYHQHREWVGLRVSVFLVYRRSLPINTAVKPFLVIHNVKYGEGATRVITLTENKQRC